MRVNHLIVGTANLEASLDFYQSILGFEKSCTFTDTGTGNEGTILTLNDPVHGPLDILLVPFLETRLPNPQHLAFEVPVDRFELIYSLAKKSGLAIRSQPSLDCKEEGVGKLDIHGRSYRNFYLFDPMRVNIELMVRV